MLAGRDAVCSLGQCKMGAFKGYTHHMENNSRKVLFCGHERVVVESSTYTRLLNWAEKFQEEACICPCPFLRKPVWCFRNPGFKKEMLLIVLKHAFLQKERKGPPSLPDS